MENWGFVNDKLRQLKALRSSQATSTGIRRCSDNARLRPFRWTFQGAKTGLDHDLEREVVLTAAWSPAAEEEAAAAGSAPANHFTNCRT